MFFKKKQPHISYSVSNDNWILYHKNSKTDFMRIKTIIADHLDFGFATSIYRLLKIRVLISDTFLNSRDGDICINKLLKLVDLLSP